MILRSVIASALIFTGCQKTPEAEKVAGLELKFVSDLHQAPDSPEDAEKTLINGKVADPKDWPASMYSAQGNSRCTSTVIGERTLLIAAHCVGNGGSARFRANNVVYSSVCTHAPGYAGNATADWSLCLIDKVVPSLPFESVNSDKALVKLGDEVMLTGFGCVQPGGGGGNDGLYRIAKSRVTSLPGRGSNDIVTSGGGALCFGDSGGPAFKIMGEKRTQISVNSRGDIRSTSYLSATHTDEAQTFFKEWATKHSQKICGVHSDATGCRGGEILPPPPPPPAGKCREYLQRVEKCLFSPTVSMAPTECYQAAGYLFSCLEEKFK